MFWVSELAAIFVIGGGDSGETWFLLPGPCRMSTLLPMSGVSAHTITFEYIVLLKMAALLLALASLSLHLGEVACCGGLCGWQKSGFETIPHVPLLTLLLSRPIPDAPMVTCSCIICFLQMATEVRPSVHVCSQFAEEGVGIWDDDAHFAGNLGR